MSYHFPDLPTPEPQVRVDGWSPARQRRFLETLAATGVIRLACESALITSRAAYNLRIRRDGAAFRLGWEAAVLIARARLADTLLSRAILGQEEVIRRDPDNYEMTRHRHDNRLAMSMLARLDRMADNPAEGSDAALARIVAQDFVAFLDMICPEDVAMAEAERLDLPRPGQEPMARTMDDARMLDGGAPDMPEPVEDATAQAMASSLSPGASVALFIAARMALRNSARAPENSQISVADERCELRTPPVVRATLPPDEAAAQLRGIWWEEGREVWRTDYPAPPGFDGEESQEIYDVDDYERDLTPEEEAAVALHEEAERRPYEDAAARARDVFFGFAGEEEAEADAQSEPG
ncbi:hypothetical protein MOK15_01250 [Sphingobium sp. BYY-5]|uniref:hypothetical protein n=1 Tax=Sphingobium sp. BYY-5 TaxID=2926400 RepID=UPI001FA7F503|nr:hypothetical protein [Sphingobium sp. BYY-5]MCI4588734.1 hypothetical protein [Sphingobium sp. BYY-5]